jgi:hypothetical protein
LLAGAHDQAPWPALGRGFGHEPTNAIIAA